ncbi:Uncharacterized protein GY17_00000755 [Cryptosporidium hominis]|uniref:Uncharacterized protein n=1 Tax=Cryptosporidium hominis TaxID=237895 RepID=A0ABX5BI45_CRYHO|nr:hypothetical protein [Cryptosporidium hominis TU502]PPS98067.1 Uncharacterized protein GY17_00000755 [Cryptosporidium hominis]|eukprot:PPS98067.1 Uncharacterized protein GY17_00000755 [Cryptosporidium hominis]
MTFPYFYKVLIYGALSKKKKKNFRKIQQTQLIICYKSLYSPVISSINSDGPGPIAIAVYSPAAICVLPASLIKQLVIFFSFALLSDSSSSLKLTFKTTLACPDLSQASTILGCLFIAFL